MYGYFGKRLTIDLTNRTTSEETFNEATARKYMGGRGFGARILFEEVVAGIDALSPKNKLIFASGPLTGTGLPGHARFQVMGKSPLTGIYGQSSAGGSFGPAMKAAGYDYIVIEGKASGPVWLQVADDGVQFRDASELWGLTTGDTEDQIRKVIGKTSVVSIGPAGERLVKIASIISDKHRAAGRTGMGCVMGAKNLKAIAVQGSQRVPVADADRLAALRQRLVREIIEKEARTALSKYGTSGGIDRNQELGLLPTRNFQEGIFKGHHKISGVRMTETILKGTTSCPGCPIGCVRSVEILEGKYAPVSAEYGGPEYEGMAALGSLCCIDNLEAIAYAHALANMYGIDTISAGVIVAWVMECYERKILRREDLDGLEVEWGNEASMTSLVEKIAKREGIGELLGKGIRIASEIVGGGSGRFAMHVKGLEIALQEPRGKKALALAYAVGARGAAHTEIPPDTAFERDNAVPEVGITQAVSRCSWEGKAEICKKGMEMATLADNIGSCHIVFNPVGGIGGFDAVMNALQSVTGWELTVAEAMEISERAVNLARAFNVREGIRRGDDRLPERFSEPLPEGGSAGESIEPDKFATALDELYAQLGWTADGIPSQEKLESLGLGHIAQALSGSDS